METPVPARDLERGLRIRGPTGKFPGQRRARPGKGQTRVWQLWTGHAGSDGAEVDLHDIREADSVPVRAPQALGPGVGFHERDVRVRAPGEAEVVQRLLVDGEEAAGRSVFRRHVRQRRPFRRRERRRALAEELHERAHEVPGSEYLRDRQHDVRRRDAGARPAGEATADHFRQAHRNGLAQHGRRRLDAADAPAEDAEGIDHGRVTVHAEQCVRIDQRRLAAVVPPCHPRQVFQVHLVADAHPRRDDAEVLEGPLSPLDELVALAVAGELDLHVSLRGVRRAGHVHHHRVVDDHVDRDDRVDVVRVAAELDHRVPHRRQIGDELDTGGVRHHQPRRPEGDLPVHGFRTRPGHGADVVLRDGLAVLVAQQVLEQHLQ